MFEIQQENTPQPEASEEAGLPESIVRRIPLVPLLAAGLVAGIAAIYILVL